MTVLPSVFHALITNGLFQKKSNTGGVEEMEFPGVLKKEHVEIPGKKKKSSGISMGVQEKLM